GKDAKSRELPAHPCPSATSFALASPKPGTESHPVTRYQFQLGNFPARIRTLPDRLPRHLSLWTLLKFSYQDTTKSLRLALNSNRCASSSYTKQNQIKVR